MEHPQQKKNRKEKIAPLNGYMQSADAFRIADVTDDEDSTCYGNEWQRPPIDKASLPDDLQYLADLPLTDEEWETLDNIAKNNATPKDPCIKHQPGRRFIRPLFYKQYIQKTMEQQQKKSRKEKIELLTGYMPEEQAQALAKRYKYLQSTAHGNDNSSIYVCTIGAVHIYDVFVEQGWFGNTPTREHPAPYPGLPIPVKGDWMVYAFYSISVRDQEGKWSDDFAEDVPFGEFAKRYNIRLKN